jgi:palmitoyltransferase ZDHHC9/14/18/palmitoyltransferase
MNNVDNSQMNIVEVNLNNGDKVDQKTNINYQGLNILNTYKDNDNSGEGLSNPQEEIEEEQEQEELSIAEIAHLKKIHEQTLLRSEKYANIYSPQNLEKSPISNSSNEKINHNKEEESTSNISHNTLEIFNENDNDHFNEQKINPNKERIFKNIHSYFYLDNEPLIIIGPDLGYFIWIFTLVSFLSILIYSLKASSYLTTVLYIFGYISFAICYILLMILNPGIPTEKKHYDINDLNFNYRQCKICNCIYHKDDFKNVNHCQECGICIEGCKHHYKLVTKCIGKKNTKVFKIWTWSCFSFSFIIFLYLIF